MARSGRSPVLRSCAASAPSRPCRANRPNLSTCCPLQSPFKENRTGPRRWAPARLARGRMLPEPDQPAVVLLALALDKALSVSPLWALAAAMPQGEQEGASVGDAGWMQRRCEGDAGRAPPRNGSTAQAGLSVMRPDAVTARVCTRLRPARLASWQAMSAA